MAKPKIGEKVFRAGSAGAWRVVELTTYEGERAVRICQPSYFSEWVKRQKIFRDAPPPTRTDTISIANLVKAKGGWRERWVQLDLEGMAP